jgi:hypothetical protein
VPRVSLLFVQELVTPHGSLSLVQALQSSAIKATSQSMVKFTNHFLHNQQKTDSTFSLSAFSDQITKFLMNLMNVHQEHQEQTLTEFSKTTTNSQNHRN